MRPRAILLAVAAIAAAPAVQAQSCPDVNDLLLTNGRIFTMDNPPNTDPVEFSWVRIIDDKIDQLGSPGFNSRGETECTEVIDLNGRVVIPGIIDNHNHIVLLGLRPGHDTRLESAHSIDEALELLAERAAGVPQGQWITSIGGYDINQFVPPPGQPRFPTLAEIDRAVPNHPVYLQISFGGPSVTNSLGKLFFETQGIEVGDDGAIAAGGFGAASPATRALFALRQLQTLDDEKRGTIDAMRYAASIGVTTHLDEGGFPATHTPSDGAAHFDQYRAYDALLALYEEDALINRIRLNFLHMEADPATPELQARLDNVFPDFGDDLLKIVGIGEFTAGNSAMISQATETWLNGTRRVAEAGWRNENHSLTQGDFQVIIDGWEQIHNELPAPGISNLRWVVAHVPFITREYADKLDALGGGVSVLGGWRYISGTAQQNGPPFRMLAESGVRMGMSSDGMQIAPMNPWLGLYYVVTGRNARGELINEGQTLPRYEALELYTEANGWFLGEEDMIGTITPGKYADLVVLSDDYFDEDAVSDEAIKDIHSLLTIVGGEIVHGSAEDL
ncbi:MAG: amidohydrolase family protein [Gammaproteobacteria bacterium]|nr:amidohydrolase family protein [Gammaproteobacteria bacterium]